MKRKVHIPQTVEKDRNFVAWYVCKMMKRTVKDKNRHTKESKDSTECVRVCVCMCVMYNGKNFMMIEEIISYSQLRYNNKIIQHPYPHWSGLVDAQELLIHAHARTCTQHTKAIQQFVLFFLSETASSSSFTLVFV